MSGKKEGRGRERAALERILKAFANQGPSAVFTMANIAREALAKGEAHEQEAPTDG